LFFDDPLPYALRDLEDLPTVLSAARAAGADAAVVVSGGVVGGASNPRIGAEVLQARLPAVAESRLFAVNGGLLALGANTELFTRRAAAYVDKILKGSRPGDLPIEQPTAFDLVVNLKTAGALGLSVPPAVLQQATEAIQ
jgi:putative ABC transport system substrate-binding protein